jgi:hypothetical protein
VGLTSPALAFLLAALVLGLLTVTFGAWPQLGRRGLKFVLLRAGVLAGLQASVLALIFVGVNDWQEFYASWPDLFGAEHGGGTVVAVHRGAPATTAPLVVTGRRRVPGQAKSRPGGTLVSVRIHGEVSGVTMPAEIYLPPGYSAGPAKRPAKPPAKRQPKTRGWPHPARAAKPLAHYPVIVMITNPAGGQGYSARQVAATAAQQIGTGRMPPAIIAMLRPGPGTDLGCLDVPGGVQGATFFSQDLPATLASRYRAGTQPSQWALAGDSAGGYCALQLALTHSWAFSAAAVPDGSYRSPPGAAQFGGSKQIRNQDNLVWLVRHQPMQPVSVLFTGPGARPPFGSLARSPMTVRWAPQAAGPHALAAVLDWTGHSVTGPGG